MKRNRPSKGNPHSLSTKQHLHSKRCIEKFAENGMVWMYRKVEDSKPVKVKPDNSCFCANWTWNHGTEQGFMKSIEDAFHSEIEEILKTSIVKKHDVISKYISLWRARVEVWLNPPADYELKGVTSPIKISIDGSEALEKAGISVMRDNVMRSQDSAGQLIRELTYRYSAEFEKAHWSLFILKEDIGEFIVPDYPAFNWFPIAPNLMLIHKNNGKNSVLEVGGNHQTLKKTNSKLYSMARKWLFSRSIKAINEAILSDDKCV